MIGGETRRVVLDVGGKEKGWPQATFVLSHTPFWQGYFGGVGIGKTLSIVHGAFGRAQEYHGSRQIITEPSYQMVRDVLVPTILDNYGELEKRAFSMTRAPPINIQFRQYSVSLPSRATHRYQPSEIWLRSTATGQRLYGPNIHNAWIDEATLGYQEEQTQILAQRCRNPVGPYPLGMKLSGTPKGRNWTWKNFIERRRPDYATFEAETKDNPHLPRGYVERLLEMYGGWDAPLARQELGGQWLQMVGPVYPQFSRQVHCRYPPKDYDSTFFKRKVGGIDFGDVAPTALVAAGLAGSGRVWAFAEWYKHQASFDDLVEAMVDFKNRYGITHWIADPSGKAEIKLLNNHGFDVVAAEHGNDIGLRTQLVGAWLNLHGGLPGCFFMPTCPNLISEIEGLSWARVKLPGRGEEIMRDQFERGAPDHAHDAWTNALTEFADPPMDVPGWAWQATRRRR